MTLDQCRLHGTNSVKLPICSTLNSTNTIHLNSHLLQLVTVRKSFLLHLLAKTKWIDNGYQLLSLNDHLHSHCLNDHLKS